MKSTSMLQTDPHFPQALLTLAQVPEQLYCRGADLAELLQKPRVAIVGSRKVSPYGRTVTTQLAGDLARAGVVIVSGLALGVDSIAHAAALDAGGLTIAVLPCGIDTIYPAGHYPLAKRILQSGGALVSEYDGAELPMKHEFIARNRIISGLSQGVLITEAAAKSGSLHTAEFALEQGIEVFAVPGNITSPTSQGTNSLIKTGATPVTTIRDILEALRIKPIKSSLAARNLSPEERAIVELLADGVVEATELQHLSQLEPAVFNQTVTMLELDGIIQGNATKWHIKTIT